MTDLNSFLKYGSDWTLVGVLKNYVLELSYVLGILFKMFLKECYFLDYRGSHIIVIRKGKIVWKLGLCCWYFSLNLKHLGWSYRVYIKTAKHRDFFEEFLCENDFETVLATFSCYDHGAKGSEAVQKIATDQKEYPKCSSCAIICWIAKTYLSINNKLWKKVGS